MFNDSPLVRVVDSYRQKNEDRSPTPLALEIGTNMFKCTLEDSSPNYHELEILVDGLAKLIETETSPTLVCEEFLASKSDDLRNILNLVAQGNTEKSFVFLKKLVVSAYGAIVYNRNDIDKSKFERLISCNPKNSAEPSFFEFKGVFDEILAECKSHQSDRWDLR